MVPEGWKASSLLSVLKGSIRNGYSPNPAEKKTGYWVLGLGALGDDGIVLDGIKPVEPTQQVLQSLLEPDDFLVSRSNTPDKVGRSLRYKGEIHNCSYPDLLMRFRVDDEKVDLDFMEQTLKSSKVRAYFKACAAGSSASMVKINKGTVENTPLHLPPLCEQRKIASILSTWDQALTTAEQLLANSQQQKKALMQLLLSGKQRLPEFSSKWQTVRFGEAFRERVETGFIELPLLSITSEEGVIDREETGRKDTSNADKSKYLRICPGDIGYNTMRMWQGVSGLSALEGLVSPAYTILTPQLGIDPLFAAYLFKLPSLVHVFYRHSQGLVSDTWNLKYANFAKIKWSIPGVEEQKAIAAVLSSADREVESLQQQLAGLKQEKKALMQQLLTGKRRVKIDET